VALHNGTGKARSTAGRRSAAHRLSRKLLNEDERASEPSRRADHLATPTRVGPTAAAHRGLADRHERRAGRAGCARIELADVTQAGYVPPSRQAVRRAGCRATGRRPHGGDGEERGRERWEGSPRDGRRRWGEATPGEAVIVARSRRDDDGEHAGYAEKTGRLGAVREGDRGETTSREKNAGRGRQGHEQPRVRATCATWAQSVAEDLAGVRRQCGACGWLLACGWDALLAAEWGCGVGRRQTEGGGALGRGGRKRLGPQRGARWAQRGASERPGAGRAACAGRPRAAAREWARGVALGRTLAGGGGMRVGR
jgi:hypothetical protein